MQPIRPGQIEECLVQGQRLHQRGVVLHDGADLMAGDSVFRHIGLDHHGLGTGLAGLEHGHGGAYTKGSRDVASRRDNAAMTTADNYRLVGQGRIIALFDTGIKRIAIEMCDA